MNTSLSLHSVKFIVLADARSGEDLAIYFNPSLPDLHKELLQEARQIWSKTGTMIRCHGGGRLSVKENVVAFYSKSLDFGHFEEQTVLRLAPEHPLFAGKNYRYFAKSGADSPHEIPGLDLRF